MNWTAIIVTAEICATLIVLVWRIGRVTVTTQTDVSVGSDG